MIGCAREDISILTSAVAYLQRESDGLRPAAPGEICLIDVPAI
jgi:hypothetical protein